MCARGSSHSRMRTIWETTETHTVRASWQAKETNSLCGVRAQKYERAQGHEEVVRDPGQENIAAKS